MSADSDRFIEPKYVLFCDDVRREDNGKLIIVGLYTSGLVIPSMPANITFTVHIAGKYLQIGERRISFRGIFQPVGFEIFGMSGTHVVTKAGDDERFGISLETDFQVQQDGEVVIQYKEEGGIWVDIERIYIGKAPSADASAPTPKERVE